ncbi:RNA polymerase subunit sigma-70 [Asanoa sp. WMMD1127]|uniref:RNA polymerase subunit sigma-70 n=1 Tax=Asanoa sp. WMMD1127 TaxID=3016107 RepID=UPI0024180489|nr:RNA polymerase subunit sigma-70 [Asanoa sp. WMMD1127]MDG4825739.1 RNA polymerase subunit sigma-70 [Asanoa sp. WMMD1127]
MDGVTEDVVARARAGDDGAFRELTAPHHRELLVHCYRMLGSIQDAEDVLQETLLAAWQGLDGYAGRASVRTWLYRIATNRCLNALRATARRPAKAWDVPQVDPPEPTRLGEVPWLEPIPDPLLDPEARWERRESVSLAFVTVLQSLPPRQVAVLLLRDVLDFPAVEVAAMLDTTVDAVKSTLKRARAGVARRDRAAAPPADSAAERAVVARFVDAWQSADVAALVNLLTDDVFMSMPPIPFEYVGRAAVARFCTAIFAAGRRFDLVPTRANGQPAFGAYLRGGGGVGLYVLTLSGDRISALTRFESHLLGRFGLPPAR